MAEKKQNVKNTEQPMQRSRGKARERELSTVDTDRFSFDVSILVGVLLIIFGIVAFFGYFTREGALIWALCVLFKGIFGWGFYVVPPTLIGAGVLLLLKLRRRRMKTLKLICILLLPLLFGGLYQLLSKSDYKFGWGLIPQLWNDGAVCRSAGVVGGLIALSASYLVSRTVAAVVYTLLTLVSLFLIFNEFIYVWFADMKAKRESRAEPFVETELMPKPEKRRKRRKMLFTKADTDEVPVDEINQELELQQQTENIVTETVRDSDLPVVEEEQPKKKSRKKPVKEEPVKEIQPEIADTNSSTDYVFPPLNMLSVGDGPKKRDSKDEVMVNKDRLEGALESFGVHAAVTNIVRGPAVTRYDMELEAGVKLNKLTNLSDDIALSLGVAGVRIAAIPNKISTVGIEVPNRNVSTVYLREIIDTPEFRSSPSKLTFALGKNIGGDAIVGNIAKLPHLLVAGTTGSGKSVCLNSLILSILYKATPDEVKFIMIDPKMVEFKIYNGIPHLLVPVVTEAKKAAGALQWAVTEMMKRYQIFSETGARDLTSYNKLTAMDPDLEPMPQVVVVIDELADLMLVAAKEVEESICRVAQMGRAAGVHLVIATQSPRSDVITGLMKANIPSRISFKVASSLESRIILDAGGSADKLMGNGDMLFAPIGVSKPMRVQGTWVTDEERENILNFIKQSSRPDYSEDVIDQIEKAAEGKKLVEDATPDEPFDDVDELFGQAVEAVMDSGQASVSYLQRRLKVGYARAARLVDQMEEKGIVGPLEGAKPRQLLIDRQQWTEMQFSKGTSPTEYAVKDDDEDDLSSPFVE